MKDENKAASKDAATIQLSRAHSTDHSDKIRQYLTYLYEHLDTSRRTSGNPQAIMLQATGFEGMKSSDGNTPPCFNLFLSPCFSEPPQSPEQWQEAFCRVYR